jgi:hypothetical protein
MTEAEALRAARRLTQAFQVRYNNDRHSQPHDMEIARVLQEDNLEPFFLVRYNGQTKRVKAEIVEGMVSQGTGPHARMLPGVKHPNLSVGLGLTDREAANAAEVLAYHVNEGSGCWHFERGELEIMGPGDLLEWQYFPAAEEQ